MTYMQLQGGAYQSRAVISAAQRCLNLYPEKTPQTQGEPSPIAHLPTPGLVRLSTAPQEYVRGLYKATTGDLYGCAGQDIYYIDPAWNWNHIGHFQPSALSDAVPRSTPVSMADNGTTLIVCDGTVDGWTFNLQTRTGWTRITDAGWYGSTRIDYLDTFFLANKPGTPIWYVSGSEAATFDAGDWVSKVAYADNTVAVVAVHRNVAVIGRYSFEWWYNSGGGGLGTTIAGQPVDTFPFDILPTFHDVGIIAPYSLARGSDQLFWLSQDAMGSGVVLTASGYNIDRISTHAIETEINTYTNIEDAVGFCYQQNGHIFYMLSFTQSDKTWCYDVMTKQWHERCWIDANGKEHRHRANCAAYAYDTNVVGDWETGDLYKFDLNTYTDTTSLGTGAIKRLRSFPHIIDTQSNRRVFYKQLIANIATGTSGNIAPQPITVIRCNFTAPDGTLMETYSNSTDLGSQFTKLTPLTVGEVFNNQLVGIGGQSLFQASGVPSSPDYSVQFRVTPDNYTIMPTAGSALTIVGRAVGTTQGYSVSVTSDGSQYQLSLTVLGGATTTVAMGTLTSSGYVVTLDMHTTVITVSAQRTADGTWLSPNALWVGSETTAINITNATYTAAGHVLIGGTW